MSRSMVGGSVLVFGFMMAGLFLLGLPIPEPLEFAAHFTLVVLPLTIGAALLWSVYRRGVGPALARSKLDHLKEEVAQRALVRGGRVSAAELVEGGTRSEFEIERALLALTAEGRARALPGAAGRVVYEILPTARSPSRGSNDSAGSV